MLIMKFSVKKSKTAEMFATNIFPSANINNKIPENGFYDIRDSCASLYNGLELVVHNDKIDLKVYNRQEENNNVPTKNNNALLNVQPKQQNGQVPVNRARRKTPPPKPPRRSISNSSSSGSLTPSLDTTPLYTCKNRKVCTSCSCDKIDHEVHADDAVNIFKMKQMNLLDDHENIQNDVYDNDQYLWIPPGLDEEMVECYMSCLPREKVPHFNNPDGIVYHNRQLIYQIPLQDSNMENITSLTAKEGYMLEAFKRERDPEMSTGIVNQAQRDLICERCDETIYCEDMYVSGGTLAPNCAWHATCFVCTQCDELLADLIYCYRNKHLYCARHHAEQIKPRCVMCDELIFGGEYVRTEDKSYHSQHFICCHCERGLTGEQHLVDSGLPICISCYDEKYASICHMCGNTIGVDDEDVIYDDEHWHDTCLVCHVCKCKLSGTSFVVKDDNFLCSECYQRTDNKRCKSCNKGFEPGVKRLELKGEFWHEMCFVCDHCKDPITSKRFINHEGKQICCPCFDTHFAKRCAKCEEVLKEGGVACGGAFYHRDCFACDSCSDLISNQPFQQKDGKRFCTPCYKNLFAKKCSACCDYIVNGEFYTVDKDNWHKECFRCKVCGDILVRQSFVQENGMIKLVCEACQ